MYGNAMLLDLSYARVIAVSELSVSLWAMAPRHATLMMMRSVLDDQRLSERGV